MRIVNWLRSTNKRIISQFSGVVKDFGEIYKLMFIGDAGDAFSTFFREQQTRKRDLREFALQTSQGGAKKLPPKRNKLLPFSPMKPY